MLPSRALSRRSRSLRGSRCLFNCKLVWRAHRVSGPSNSYVSRDLHSGPGTCRHTPHVPGSAIGPFGTQRCRWIRGFARPIGGSKRVIANQRSDREPHQLGRANQRYIPARRKQYRPAGQTCGRAGFPGILLLCFMSHRTYDRQDTRPGHRARHLLLTSNSPDCAQIDAGDGSCHHSPVARVAAGDP